jgi:hypothetical protein
MTQTATTQTATTQTATTQTATTQTATTQTATTQTSLSSASVSGRPPHPHDDGRAQAGVELLQALAASLEGSMNALLARDLGGLEQATREQARLQREFEILGRLTGPGHAGEGFKPSLVSDEFRAAGKRVIHLGRVQLALLARGERWLRTLARLAAGPGASYGPPQPAGQGTLPPVGPLLRKPWSLTGDRKGDPACQA